MRGRVQHDEAFVSKVLAVTAYVHPGQEDADG